MYEQVKAGTSFFIPYVKYVNNVHMHIHTHTFRHTGDHIALLTFISDKKRVMLRVNLL